MCQFWKCHNRILHGRRRRFSLSKRRINDVIWPVGMGDVFGSRSLLHPNFIMYLFSLQIKRVDPLGSNWIIDALMMARYSLMLTFSAIDHANSFFCIAQIKRQYSIYRGLFNKLWFLLLVILIVFIYLIAKSWISDTCCIQYIYSNPITEVKKYSM